MADIRATISSAYDAFPRDELYVLHAILVHSGSPGMWPSTLCWLLMLGRRSGRPLLGLHRGSRVGPVVEVQRCCRDARDRRGCDDAGERRRCQRSDVRLRAHVCAEEPSAQVRALERRHWHSCVVCSPVHACVCVCVQVSRLAPRAREMAEQDNAAFELELQAWARAHPAGESAPPSKAAVETSSHGAIDDATLARLNDEWPS